MAQNLTIGNPKAMAMANAVTADFVGLDNVHYNPAGLVDLKGRQFETKIIAAYMDIRAEFEPGDNYDFFGFDADDDPVSYTKSQTATPAMYIPGVGLTSVPALIAPLNGVSFNPPGSKFTFANNLYAPMALGFSRDEGDDPAAFQGQKVALQRITYLSPSIGYKVNDQLDVGLSVGFSHQALAMEQKFRSPNDLLALNANSAIQTLFCDTPGIDILTAIFLDICQGDANPFANMADMSLEMTETLSPTYNLGLRWKPYDWLRFGLVYQSEAKMNLKGNYSFEYSDDFFEFMKGFAGAYNPSIFGAALVGPISAKQKEEGIASMKLTYPQHISGGVSVDLTPKLTMNFDLKWTDYDVWENFVIEFDRQVMAMQFATILAPANAQPNRITMPRGYESKWSWAIGFEYDVSNRLSLRWGYENRPSSIPADKADIMAPLGDAHIIGLGFGYQWDKESVVDVGFQYFWSKQEIPAGTSCNVNCDGITDLVYNPYAGMDLETSVNAYIFSLSYRTRF